MTQEEAYKCLKKYKKWMTTKEVVAKTGMSSGAASKNLLTLYRYHEAERQRVRVSTYWTYKWRIR